MQNNKGLTPLLMAVEMANLEMFRFLFEIMIHLQTTQGKCSILTDQIDLTDVKQETALLKAIRTDQLKVANIILDNVGPDHLLGYESLLVVDISCRNVLHYGVINKQKDIVEKLIKLDSDSSSLRK